jgi:hypothetical protein
MSAYHESPEEIKSPDGAYVGLPGRVANLLSRYTGREASLLGFLTWSGVWLGRSVYTHLDGLTIYPNIFTMLVGSVAGFKPTLQLINELMDGLGNKFFDKGSGVVSRLSVIHPVRDRLVRPERMNTKPGEVPQFWQHSPVDEGTQEGRMLISKTGIAWGSKPVKPLADVLLEAFMSGTLAHFMSYRDGGYLQSSKAHIGLVATCSIGQFPRNAPGIWDACLFGEESPGPFHGKPNVKEDLEYIDVQASCEMALLNAGGEIPLTRGALDFIRGVTRHVEPGRRTMTILKLTKLALEYAVFNGAAEITADHAYPAHLLVKRSENVLHTTEVDAAVDRVSKLKARAIEKLMANSDDSPRRTDIVKGVFHGHVNSTDIDEIRDRLISEGRIRVSMVPRDGRGSPTEIWHIIR